jgi:hypothetical protein
MPSQRRPRRASTWRWLKDRMRRAIARFAGVVVLGFAGIGPAPPPRPLRHEDPSAQEEVVTDEKPP